jgi:FkbM family methyltransferase
MKGMLQRAVGAALRTTGLQFLPVRVRRGFNAGARWTLYPWSAYWRGDYEPQVEQALEGLGELRGKSCWDLGAHFGYYSIGLARRVGPGGQVAAFEPFPSSFARLERHARMNRLPQLRTYPYAVSDATGMQPFITDTREGDTTVHFPYEGESLGPQTPVLPVRTVRLDDLVAAGEIRPPDLIKIDVEGHGHRALAGAAETLRRHRPAIVMGIHSEAEVEGARAVLDPLGYEWMPLGGGDGHSQVGQDYLLRSR